MTLPTVGVKMGVSAGDITVMDVIGYNVAVPEPTTLTLLGIGGVVASIIVLRRKLRN